MRILILSGSPRTKDNSVHLARRFAEGAQQAGHEVVTLDCTALEIAGCRASFL